LDGTANDMVENQKHLEATLARFPDLRERIVRALLIALHSRGIITLEAIHGEAQQQSAGDDGTGCGDPDASKPAGRRWDAGERRAIAVLVKEHAARHFSREEIDDLVNLTRKREEAESLEEMANLPTVSLELLASKVKDFCRLPRGRSLLSPQESLAARVALIRKFISDQLEFIAVAKHHLRIRDFDDLVDRIIGRKDGMGLIGGKAGGMLLAERILAAAQEMDSAAPHLPFRTPKSFFLRSDVLEDFVRHNGLQHLLDQKYKSIEDIRYEFPMVLDLFRNADFPVDIQAQMATVLERVGTHPLIVRSSSLLEDRFGTAFAGKYRSLFVANQGTSGERLQELLGAVAEVYASTFHPDPISYRQRHGLLDYSENMGVLVQKLVGQHVGDLFLPVWSGVGFSRNPHRRSPRIRPEDGLARVVFGLGTRAVDRVASDFPRMIPLGLPSLRAEVGPEDLMRESQREVDAIDLKSGGFISLPLAEVLRRAPQVTGLGLVCSYREHGFVRPLAGDRPLAAPEDLLITFDRFGSSSPWPAFLRWCLQTLERAYGCPVDIEFASDGRELYLLQCRPQARYKEAPAVMIPTDVPEERRVFTARRDVVGGSIHGLTTVILVDPRAYHALATGEQRVGVAQVVRALNSRLASHPFALMGPGRWGSRDLRLGVRVGYADIHNARLLVEIAYRRNGYLPEVSFGSHFFQDLAESDIRYLALYPEEPGVKYDESFLCGGPNALTELLPAAAAYTDVVRVIDVPRVTGGMVLNVDMDAEHQEALGYLVPASAI
jgi:pyruvate,water dikinase